MSRIPSTPAAATAATALAHSSNSPDATIAARSGRCGWPYHNFIQSPTAAKAHALPASPREMLCKHSNADLSSR